MQVVVRYMFFSKYLTNLFKFRSDLYKVVSCIPINRGKQQIGKKKNTIETN